MKDIEQHFHETWLGMAQPIEGLVVSIPVLKDAQCMVRQSPASHQHLRKLFPHHAQGVIDMGQGSQIKPVPLAYLLTEFLQLTPHMFHQGEQLPKDLELYVVEGEEILRPTMALCKQAQDKHSVDSTSTANPGSGVPPTPASRAGEAYTMLVWEIPTSQDFDKPDMATYWRYPPASKFDRLLRHCGVPIGLLSNGIALRLLYAPHGESTGSLTFNLQDMATSGGKPLFDAFVMLLSAQRFFGVEAERQLPSILQQSRRRQAEVTTALSEQVLEAVEKLLQGFAAAAQRDGGGQLQEAMGQPDDHLYHGLLTVLLRLVFLLYSEDRDLLPISQPLYKNTLGLIELYHQLQQDMGNYPDTMGHRYGAWGRLLALFRAVYLGLHHHQLTLPARRGDLFDPNTYPFLEGWSYESNAPVYHLEAQSQVRIPSISDETVYQVLDRLMMFEGQRLSYRALDVEQIGSIYEGLMGYHVQQLRHDAICLRGNKIWLSAKEVLAIPSHERLAWLKKDINLDKTVAIKLAKSLEDVQTVQACEEILEAYKASGTQKRKAGDYVLQPGKERKRTSSHYTPRSMTEPIVETTLKPLLQALGEHPTSEDLLNLKICDPAMGSGAFLVSACRYLADQVRQAWTREGQWDKIASVHEDALNYARRLVAQRCLYGVDKNSFAVNLAKLALWLYTLAKDTPFTFLDHCLQCGDSLIGLSLKQIASFDWGDEKTLEEIPLLREWIDASLSEAYTLRQQILNLAFQNGSVPQQEKRRLLQDADDALKKVREIGDLVLWCFFTASTERERRSKRDALLAEIIAWLEADTAGKPEHFDRAIEELHRIIKPFHWQICFPEAFFRDQKLDLLEQIDAFIGNPPFAGSTSFREMEIPNHLDWLKSLHENTHGNADYCAHFFRRSFSLLGEYGTMGFIATNTISQGDTRQTGLEYITHQYGTIYAASKSIPWPGEAAVTVSFVHVGKGNLITKKLQPMLDKVAVPKIDSRLETANSFGNPFKLKSNEHLSFQGTKIYGQGFILTPEEREELIKKNSKNSQLIFPYIGGEEVNTSPIQMFHRYVIDFGDRSLEEAKKWPDLFDIVEEKVKPEREKNKRENRREKWWQFGEKSAGLYRAISNLNKCIVASQVTKHLCFSFMESGVVFSHKLIVFPLEQISHYTCIQSRIHEMWVRLFSSTFGEGLNYSPTDCFNNFPFPQPDPRIIIPSLESIGKIYYDTRAKYMVDTDQGMTKTYNHMKDPQCTDPAILHLRELHEAMDRAVLDAYGWQDIQVPPYLCSTQGEMAAFETFKSQVLERLFALNAQRAAEEAAAEAIDQQSQVQSAGKKNRKRRKTTA